MPTLLLVLGSALIGFGYVLAAYGYSAIRRATWRADDEAILRLDNVMGKDPDNGEGKDAGNAAGSDAADAGDSDAGK